MIGCDAGIAGMFTLHLHIDVTRARNGYKQVIPEHPRKCPCRRGQAASDTDSQRQYMTNTDNHPALYTFRRIQKFKLVLYGAGRPAGSRWEPEVVAFRAETVEKMTATANRMLPTNINPQT